jgi:response regulator RpfG family c-di-GMP phosphodiesterase
MEMLRKMDIDLIVVDILLEDVPGDRLCGMVMSEGTYPGLSMILVCRDDQEEFERLKGCGAHALIAKPIKPLQLIKTVSQFLTVQLVRSRRVTLRVKVVSKKEDIEFFCISHNISVTGMMIETEYHFDIGSIITCIFTIPGSIEIEAEGEIIRSTRTMEGSYQYGIHFAGLSREFRQEIDLYIARIARGEISNNEH